jgi:hypothetical protein
VGLRHAVADGVLAQYDATRDDHSVSLSGAHQHPPVHHHQLGDAAHSRAERRETFALLLTCHLGILALGAKGGQFWVRTPAGPPV